MAIFLEEESAVNLVPTALFSRFRAGREKSPYIREIKHGVYGKRQDEIFFLPKQGET